MARRWVPSGLIMWRLSLDLLLTFALLGGGVVAALIIGGLLLLLLLKSLRRLLARASLPWRLGLGQLLRHPLAAAGQSTGVRLDPAVDGVDRLAARRVAGHLAKPVAEKRAELFRPEHPACGQAGVHRSPDLRCRRNRRPCTRWCRGA